MKHNFLLSIVLFFIHSTLLFSQNLITSMNEPIQPIFKNLNLDKDKILLGKKLFFDTRLSTDNTVSCATCHKLELAGVDNLEKSFGVLGQVGMMNTPTILNSSNNFVQFWDGRAKTLEDQIDGPIKNPVEMASNWHQIIGKLKQDSLYIKQFRKSYDTINEKNIKNAIVEFEKSLITPSRFDKYLQGDKDILSTEEKRGYELFKEYGCSSCHQGKNVGGNFYEKLGVFKKYIYEETEEHLGRYNLLKTEESKYEFRVPSLRNVTKTFPYLHDGSIKSLKKVIRIMGKYQLGRDIPDNDIEDIEDFLNSLTWEKLEKDNDVK